MTSLSKAPLEVKTKSTLSRFLPLAVIGGVFAFIYAMGWHHYFSFETLIKHKSTLTGFVATNLFTALFLYILLYAAVTALSLPVATFLTLAGGFLFGGLFGGIATIIGATTGALIIFKIAQSSFGDSLVSRAGPMVEKMRNGFKEDAMSYMLFLRLVPIFPFWLVNIAPALLSVKTSTYTLGTFLGIIPGTMAFSYAAASLSSIIDAQAETYHKCIVQFGESSDKCGLSLDTSSLVTKELIIAFALLGVLALIPIAFKKMKQKQQA